MGGLWATMPRLSALGLFLAMASLGLPGLANFVGEFLVLLGTYRSNAPLAIVATGGLVASAAYALRLVQRAFHGENVHDWRLPDASRRETAILVPLAVAIAWLGLAPQVVLRQSAATVSSLPQTASRASSPAASRRLPPPTLARSPLPAAGAPP